MRAIGLEFRRLFSSIIIMPVLILLQLHKHSARSLDVMNLTRGYGVGSLDLSKSSCHAHLFVMAKVILSSFRLSLLILDHHVTYHSELLCLRRSQHPAALSYYHLRVVVLLSDLAGFEQSMGGLQFIGDHNLVLFKVSIARPEDVIDILRSKLSCYLSINDLFFLSVLFQHGVKQSIHAL